jgi:hypothetical protein
MRKLIFVLVLIFASALTAQMQPSFFLLRQTIACTSSLDPCTPSHDTYLLVIAQNGNPQVVAYQYTITATLVSGEIRTVSGSVERADNPAGNTSVPLDFGEDINRYSITVQDLGVLSVRVRSTPR